MDDETEYEENMPTPERPVYGRAAFLTATGLLFALALALRLYRLGARGLGFEESCVALLLQQDLGSALRTLRHLPRFPLLHHLLQFLLVANPGSAFWLRLPPAVAGAVGIPVTVALASALGAERRTALLAGTLTAIAPLAVFCGQEASPYVWALVVSALSHLLLLRLINRAGGKTLAAYVIVTTAGLYLHALFILAVAAQAVFAAIELADRGPQTRSRTAVKRVIIAFAAVALLAIPLALLLIAARLPEAARLPLNRAYLDRVAAAFSSGWQDTAGLPAGWQGARLLFVILWLIGLVFMARRNVSHALLAATALIVPVLAGSRLAGWTGDAFSTGALLFALPFYLIPVAEGVIGLGRPFGPITRIASGGVISVLAIAALALPLAATYRTGEVFDGREGEPWREAIEHIERTSLGEMTRVFVFPGEGAIPLATQRGARELDIVAIYKADDEARGDALERLTWRFHPLHFNDERDGPRFFEPFVDGWPNVWLVLYRHERVARAAGVLTGAFETLATEIDRKRFGDCITVIRYTVPTSRYARSRGATRPNPRTGVARSPTTAPSARTLPSLLGVHNQAYRLCRLSARRP